MAYPLKYPYDQILDFYVFTFSYTKGFTIRTHVFLGRYFREFTAAINVPSSQVLFENWSKWRHLLKNTTLFEIQTTINVEDCKNIWVKDFFIAVLTVAIILIFLK